MNREQLDLKRIVLASIFLSFFILGTYLIFTTPSNVKIVYNRTVQTKDKEQISFDTFQPKEHEKRMKAVIIGHGIMVNKEMLKDFALEIAASGYFVVTVDFRGHGLSTGELKMGRLINEIKAIKNYLKDRGDIDYHNLGYIGYSMGGRPGNKIVKEDGDFKCFIGIGTSLDIDYEDSLNRDLTVLMILGKYDQAFDLKHRKEEIADRLDIDTDDVHINKLYGNFEDKNATKLFLDDNSDHFTTAYDQDFIREARDWIINTFRDVDPPDYNFYANLRALILIMQLVGGIGFFFLIIDPISKIVSNLNTNFIRKKESAKDPIPKSKTDAEVKTPFKFNTENETIKSLSLKTLFYSMQLAIPGYFISICIFLFLPLSMAGFTIVLLFGQAYGIFIMLWRIAKKSNLKIKDIFLGPFKMSRDNLLRQILLGTIISIVLYVILYLSIGLNYLGIVPALHKVLWIPIYFAIAFIIFLVYNELFHMIILEKFKNDLKNLVKVVLLIVGFQLVYTITYILLLCFLLGSFFFAIILYIAIPLYVVCNFASALLYQKTKSIIAGTLVSTVVTILLVATLSPFMLGIEMMTVFAQ